VRKENPLSETYLESLVRGRIKIVKAEENAVYIGCSARRLIGH
jgi:hypothetical protein